MSSLPSQGGIPISEVPESDSPAVLSPARSEVSNLDAESVSPKSSVGSEQSLTTQVGGSIIEVCIIPQMLLRRLEVTSHQATDRLFDCSCSLGIDPTCSPNPRCQQAAPTQALPPVLT